MLRRLRASPAHHRYGTRKSRRFRFCFPPECRPAKKIQRSLDAKGLSALLPFGRSGRYIIRLTNLIRSVGKAACRGRVDLRLPRRFADGKVRVQQLQSQLVSCFFRLFFALSLRFQVKDILHGNFQPVFHHDDVIVLVNAAQRANLRDILSARFSLVRHKIGHPYSG